MFPWLASVMTVDLRQGRHIVLPKLPPSYRGNRPGTPSIVTIPRLPFKFRRRLISTENDRGAQVLLVRN